jgi:hypothetical protein
MGSALVARDWQYLSNINKKWLNFNSILS